MSDLNRDERLQIMLTNDELSALDDWRFARRMPSRAAAVRELLRLGLAAQGIDLAEQRRKSQDFGIMGGVGKVDVGAKARAPTLDGDGAG